MRSSEVCLFLCRVKRRLPKQRKRARRPPSKRIKIVKAVILAAGKGTRMGELTHQMPKPMLYVLGRPILEHIIRGLAAAGVHDFCIVTGWRAEVIEKHFGDGSRLNMDVRIHYARQEVQDGTGKAPEVARDFVGGETFFLTYGDILVKPETYTYMVRRWGDAPFSGLMTVTGSEDVTQGGLVFFDDEFCLRRIVEKPTAAHLEQLRLGGWLKPGQTAWYNAGVQLFRPALFDFTAKLEKSPRGEYELTDAITAMVAGGHRIAGLEILGRWVDVRDAQVLGELDRGER